MFAKEIEDFETGELTYEFPETFNDYFEEFGEVYKDIEYSLSEVDGDKATYINHKGGVLVDSTGDIIDAWENEPDYQPFDD